MKHHNRDLAAAALLLLSLPVGCGTASNAPDDGGVTAADTGVTPTDNGVTPTDNGVAPTDRGVAPTDRGVAPTDTGVAPTDSGTAPGACTTTAGVQCDYNRSVMNTSPSVNATSTSRWTCTATTRVLAANGIPDHDVGTFPSRANPNAITAQTISATYTLTPTSAGRATRLGGPSGVVGYMLNGVKLDPGTGGSCDNTGTNCSLAGMVGPWNMEALGQTSFNFGDDANHAHVQPGGTYHYHGVPVGLVARLGGGPTRMTLIGWAADGFPIYAQYGHSVATDASSPLRIMRGSYRFVSTPSATRPPVSMYALGTFTQDYEYAAGSGDLDECNGRTGVTPEFPCGIYHYYATDTYPFLQRCVRGTVTGGTTMPPMGDGGVMMPPMGDGGTMLGPRACTTAAECTGACPAGSAGCTCAMSPMGRICVPTCSTDRDCPAGPMGPMRCNTMQRICVPAM